MEQVEDLVYVKHSTPTATLLRDINGSGAIETPIRVVRQDDVSDRIS
jgi:hypothetical protein